MKFAGTVKVFRPRSLLQRFLEFAMPALRRRREDRMGREIRRLADDPEQRIEFIDRHGRRER